MPGNLHFHTHDAFSPFPPEHQGKYDVVALRFFLTLTNTEKVALLMENFKALLSMRPVCTALKARDCGLDSSTLKDWPICIRKEPGGYLQWLEPDMLTAKAIAANPETSKSACERMASLMRKPTPDAEYK